jgi:hypothetical protein
MTFHFKFCAEGALEMDQTAVFTVSVQEEQQGLTLTPDGGALPQETVGTPVSDLVTVVSGGEPPYTFSITDGATPDGVELNSETNADGTETITLDGTPTTAGDFSFTLDVEDSSTPPQKASVKAAVKSKKPVSAKRR